MSSASTRFQESTLESWARAPAWNLWFGACFQDSTLESWVQDLVFQESILEFWDRDFLSGVGIGFKSQLWNLRLRHPFSGVNSGIFEFLFRHLLSGTNSGIRGLGTCFRKRFWFSGIISRNFGGAPVFRSQLWNLRSVHLLSGINSRILGLGPDPVSGVDSGILGAGTRFQESTLES